MAVLEQGGNAFDAAVAAGLTLQVVEPHLNGPGGDLPAILFPVERGEPVVLCAQGPAPRAATIAHYRDELGLPLVPGTGPLAAVVPGAFGGWMAMLRDYGTLPFAEVAKYAIHYAEHGYPVIPAIANAIRNVEQLLRDEWTTSAEVYLPVPEPGGLHRNPRLAQTYRRLAESDDPVEEWYRGFVAEAIVGFQEREWMDSSGVRHAGLLAEDDLRDWSPTYEQPLAVDYHGLSVLKAGPWSQAPVFLQQLRAARRLRPRGDGTRLGGVRPHRRPSARSSRSRTARRGTATPTSSTCRSTRCSRARTRTSGARSSATRRRRSCGPARPTAASRACHACAETCPLRPASASRHAATPSTSTSSTAGATWSRPRRAAAGCGARR